MPAICPSVRPLQAQRRFRGCQKKESTHTGRMPALNRTFQAESPAPIGNQDFPDWKARRAPWLPAEKLAAALLAGGTGLVIRCTVALRIRL